METNPATNPGPAEPPRILIIDDNPHIHSDFQLVLTEEFEVSDLEADEERLYGTKTKPDHQKPIYRLDHALSGLEGIEKVKQAVAENHPYQVGFVDIRMPGLDGVQTIERIWQIDTQIQIVICTAYADYSQKDLFTRLGQTDKLLLLKKPFDAIEVTQLARTLTEKWYLARQAALKLEQMELLVSQRTQRVLDLQRRESLKLNEPDRMTCRLLVSLSEEFLAPAKLISDLAGQNPAGRKADVQEQIFHQAGRLAALAGQMRYYGELGVDELKPEPADSDLISFINRVVQTFLPAAQRKRIKLTVTFRPQQTSRVISFDGQKLDTILSNLLTQALFFAKENGAIGVFVQFAESALQISVEDDGPGIPRQELPFVFDPFEKSDRSARVHDVRRGIGLAVTQKLVHACGGSIAVESTTGGEGAEGRARTCFTVTFPLAISASGVPILGDYAPPARLEQRPQAGPTGQPLDKKSPIILLVESDPSAAAYISEVFGNQYEVVHCHSDQAGLEKTVELVPDLVVADIQMPSVNGLRLCQELKNGLITSHIPVILFTLHGTEDYQLKAVEAGADDYIAKPFNLSAIRERAEKVLKLHRISRVRAGRGTRMQPREMAANRTDAAFLQKVMGVVEQNLSDCEFDVDTLAEKAGISRRQLFRKLKAVVDLTPNSFVRSIRLKRAAQLITESQMTITEITFAVGFLDLKHFRIMFKDEFGVLPSEYPKKQP